jgi:hypothetical protein
MDGDESVGFCYQDPIILQRRNSGDDQVGVYLTVGRPLINIHPFREEGEGLTGKVTIAAALPSRGDGAETGAGDETAACVVAME